jgi:hypothetical protein
VQAVDASWISGKVIHTPAAHTSLGGRSKLTWRGVVHGFPLLVTV